MIEYISKADIFQGTVLRVDEIEKKNGKKKKKKKREKERKCSTIA